MNNIVAIAHDAKKPELAQFIQDRLEWLRGVNLIATGRTAEFIESQGLSCKHMSPGQSGGYVQITQMIEEGNVDMVIFLRDHKVIQKHHEDIRKLLEACNVKNIPLATNYASAELIILGLLKKQAIERSKRKE
ncbi:MAG TPA: methylglyoxal synthase [Bacteroidales bacterium]|jgi:methylglyoxal synthase|nr:methylglyoxal synthase [Bacteroidales bacterium]MDD3891718.1 methylglyoxal synthase [Bacteroidales bacterium]HCY01378.1 methylglyoxal synthase [Bacteroidales bacterium]